MRYVRRSRGGSLAMLQMDRYASCPCACISRAICRTRRSYAARSCINRWKASACAGSPGLGSFSRSCTPSRSCLMVMAGFQLFSSSV